jgi:hypothetical protein
MVSFQCATFLVQAYNNKSNTLEQHEFEDLLIKSSEFMDNIKTETHEIIMLSSTIAFLLHDAPKLKLMREKLNDLYYTKLWPLPISDVYFMFLLSTHCGKWSDMRYFLKHLDERDPNFSKQYIQLIEQERDSFNYMTIMELSANLPDEDLAPVYEKFGFEKFEVMLLTTIQTRKNDPVMPEVETTRDLNEEEWIPVDHEIPDMIAFGSCMAWYQLNGEIHLSGVQSNNFEKILLKGRGKFDREEDVSHFTTEYSFTKVSGLYYEGTHSRNVINHSKITKLEVLQQLTTFKIRATLKQL